MKNFDLVVEGQRATGNFVGESEQAGIPVSVMCFRRNLLLGFLPAQSLSLGL